MADPSSKLPSSRLVYDGAVFRIECCVAPGGAAPAEVWLEPFPLGGQQKFSALFARMGDTGKIWNERKFKHLTETDQIFEFKVEADRIRYFFFIGRRQNSQTRNRPSRSL
jgi:hypothetical protein